LTACLLFTQGLIIL